MELSRLAAKQKRYKEILHFTEAEVRDTEIKSRLLATLATYRAALAACWKAQALSAEQTTSLVSLERSLAELHNQARLETARR